MHSKRTPEATCALPEVFFSDEGHIRHLHLGTPWIQGSIHMDDPYLLELEYVQRMMVWLLFVCPESVRKRHAMQLGLGAGSLSKFSRKRLHMQTTAIELNPNVVRACRSHFKLPAEDSRLQIVLANAAEEIRKPQWLLSVDALQVDLYDHEAAAPVLDDVQFYADCRALLREDGCMSVNLFGRSNRYQESVQKITAAFGEDAVWAFKPTREGNTVVMAQRTPTRPKRSEMLARADEIKARWGLPADKWTRGLKPLVR